MKTVRYKDHGTHWKLLRFYWYFWVQRCINCKNVWSENAKLEFQCIILPIFWNFNQNVTIQTLYMHPGVGYPVRYKIPPFIRKKIHSRSPKRKCDGICLGKSRRHVILYLSGYESLTLWHLRFSWLWRCFSGLWHYAHS